MNRILITGAAGKIGAPYVRACAGGTRCCALPTSRQSIRRAPAKRSCAPISPISPKWKAPCAASIVFEAARRQGVGPSSMRVRTTWPGSIGARFIDQTVVPRPDGVYGVSKAFRRSGRTPVCRQHGLSVACLRIGAFRDKPADRRSSIAGSAGGPPPQPVLPWLRQAVLLPLLAARPARDLRRPTSLIPRSDDCTPVHCCGSRHRHLAAGRCGRDLPS
jgi:hypothetical protein